MRSFKHYIALVLIFFCYLTSYAHDFEVDGIYYNITSSSNLEVEVTHWSSFIEPSYQNSYTETSNTTPYSGNIIIPEIVKYNNKSYTVVGIGQYAFGVQGNYSATNITTIMLPNTIKTIGARAFCGCKSLTNVRLSDSIISMDYAAFAECTNLSEVTLSSSLTEIPDAAFQSSGIRTINIPNKVNKIGWGAFASCEDLESIVIGKDVTKMNGAIYSCPKLKEVFYLGEKLPDTGSCFDMCHSSLEQYLVRNYISFDTNVFTYTGVTPTTSWSNNLKQLNCELDFPELQKNAGYHEVICSAGFSGSVEFVCEIPYKYTINKALLTITANNKNKTYGDENPVFDASFSGFVNNEGKGDLLKFELTTTATTSSDAGTYPILVSAEAKNYDITATNGTLTIGKAPLTATVNSSEKVYGDENPTFSVTYSGLKNNDTNPNPTQNVTFTTDANLLSDVGTYPVTVVGGEFKNYEITKYVSGTLTINKAPLTITCNDATKVYGDVNPTFSFTYTGLKNNDTEEKAFSLKPSVDTDITRRTGVGEYEIIGSNAASKNYKLEYVKGTLTITKAPLSITANDATRVYGEANPVFTFKYEGFKNDETEEVLIHAPIATSVGRTADVGEYNIVPDGATASNYNISYNNGTLTITKAPLEVTVNNASRIYGETNPEFTCRYTGFKNDDDASCITTQPTVVTDATVESPVGTYTLSASNGSAKNYEFKKYTNGTLTIGQAELKVMADNIHMTYGDAVPTLTYTCSGLKNNDTNASAFSKVPSLNCTVSSASNCGEYAIQVSGGASINYIVSYENGIMTVDKRELVSMVGNYTRPYNTENPQFGIKYSGFVNNDNESHITTEPTISCAADRTSDTGDYEITLYGGNAQNYSFAFVNGTLTVEKAEQEIVWEQDFENVAVGEQIELTAHATSGLEIEYSVSNESIATLYTAGKNRIFLDCVSEGTVIVKAKQSGNNNYYSTIKLSKTIKIGDTSGIENIAKDTPAGSDIKKYNLNGQQVTNSAKGIIIVNGKKYLRK